MLGLRLSTERPTVFGKYELLERVGRGGMGEAWKARPRGAGPQTPLVLIKRVLPEWSQDLSFVEAFVEESRITALLDNPHLARVLDFGQVNGEYFLAIEYIHGRTLEALLEALEKRGPKTLPLPIACFLVAELLAGLRHAHTAKGPDGRPANVVHRDIAPDNVMLSFEGDTKLVDFGVAKARLRGRKSTVAGVVKGKWLFFSPEQAAGSKAIDARSDLFSTGVVLYRLVCGQLPFQGDLVSVVRKISVGEFPEPLAVRADLPTPLAELILRAMHKNPDQRYQTAERMEAALRNWLLTFAPTTNRDTLRTFVHWAFADQLAGEGVQARVSISEAAGLEAWTRGDAPSAAILPEATTSTTQRTDAHQLPPLTRRRSPLIGGALFAVGLALAVFASRALMGDPHASSLEQRKVSLAKVEQAFAALKAVSPERAAEAKLGLEALEARAEVADRAGDKAFAFDCETFAARLSRTREEVLNPPPQEPEAAPHVDAPPAPELAAETPAADAGLQLRLQETLFNRGAIREGEKAGRTLRDPTFPAFDDSYAFDPLQPMPLRDDPLGPSAQAAVKRNFSNARLALSRQDWPGATTALNACIAVYPRSADCHRLLGFAYAKIGATPRALEHYRAFLKLQPGHAAAEELKKIVQEGEKKK
jgi:eukaryotic-like serine/threonine-protein kinase